MLVGVEADLLHGTVTRAALLYQGLTFFLSCTGVQDGALAGSHSESLQSVARTTGNLGNLLQSQQAQSMASQLLLLCRQSRH